MLSYEMVVVASVIALMLGVVLGIVAGRFWLMPSKQKAIEQSLTDTLQELDTLKQNINQHFTSTLQKVRNLNNSYRELNDHLALGAMQMASTDIGRQLYAATDSEPSNTDLPLAAIEPPKDWAPKLPGRVGMLSEDFGLKDEDDAYSLTDPKMTAHRGI